jgi:hypothetical protein
MALWNFKSADHALQRSIQQFRELPCEQSGWNWKNLWGVGPFGQYIDDDDEMSPIDVGRGLARNLEGNPSEFFHDVSDFVWEHALDLLGELGTIAP